jgi:hypothetical protein
MRNTSRQHADRDHRSKRVGRLDPSAAADNGRTPSDAGIRVVNLRFGVILCPKGGALAKMLLPFKLGGGGRVGSGKQYRSWISIDDAAGAVHHALMTDSLSGPVNAVAPNAVTNAEFTKTLGRVLHRPTMVPMPAFAARLALGEMADELLLASIRVEPKELNRSGYDFRQPTLESALQPRIDITKIGEFTSGDDISLQGTRTRPLVAVVVLSPKRIAAITTKFYS